ncbi:DUF5988 family protein [Embleya sp. AB8]|uniref:DUF5988 family protein n=1 Tax=Embleya sp. AB8 TaxID=3156304 RepID=UPI003C71046B
MMTEVVLLTGPGDHGRPCRVPRTAEGAEPDRITADRAGRRANFERTGEIATVDGRELSIYRWTYDLVIAE